MKPSDRSFSALAPRIGNPPLAMLLLVLCLVLIQPDQASAVHPPPAFVAGGTNPFGLVDVGDFSVPSFADLDGDGDLDAFFGEIAGNTMFFENSGTATSPAFAAAVTNPFGLADVGDQSAPSFADLDGDGDLDAFIGEKLGITRFFENTGTAVAPAFATLVASPFGLADVGRASQPSFVDLDGDGDLDAFIGEIYGTASFFENSGTATSPAFAAPVSNPFGLADVGTYNDPSFADLDGDGDFDAFVGEVAGNTMFFENSGTATSPAFAAAVTNPFGLTGVGDQSTPSFADLDGDGDLDAFIGERFGRIFFFENTRASANPMLVARADNPFGLADVGSLSTPSFVDLDGDGDLDAFIGEIGGNTKFFENSGMATSPAFAAAVNNPFGLADVGNGSNPSFADLDGDGDLDAFIGVHTGNTRFFENSGTATSPAFAAAVDNPFGLADVGQYSAPSFADLDGDGDLDAFIGDQQGITKFFENSGTAISPAFASVVNNPFGLGDVGDWSKPSFADLDGDGDLDAFFGEQLGNTKSRENTGTAISPAFAIAVNNPFGLSDVGYNNAPSFADLDGDGDLDAFIGENGGNTKFFENTTPVPVELIAFEIE